MTANHLEEVIIKNNKDQKFHFTLYSFSRASQGVIVELAVELNPLWDYTIAELYGQPEGSQLLNKYFDGFDVLSRNQAADIARRANEDYSDTLDDNDVFMREFQDIEYRIRTMDSLTDREHPDCVVGYLNPHYFTIWTEDDVLNGWDDYKTRAGR